MGKHIMPEICKECIYKQRHPGKNTKILAVSFCNKHLKSCFDSLEVCDYNKKLDIIVSDVKKYTKQNLEFAKESRKTRPSTGVTQSYNMFDTIQNINFRN